MPQALLCAGLDTNMLGLGSLHCHTALPKHLSSKTKPMEKMSLQITANPEDTEKFSLQCEESPESVFSLLLNLLFLSCWEHHRHNPMEPALQEAGKHGAAACPDIPQRHTVTLQRAITVEKGLIPPKEGIACFLKQHMAILNDVPSNLVNLKGFHYIGPLQL